MTFLSSQIDKKTISIYKSAAIDKSLEHSAIALRPQDYLLVIHNLLPFAELYAQNQNQCRILSMPAKSDMLQFILTKQKVYHE